MESEIWVNMVGHPDHKISSYGNVLWLVDNVWKERNLSLRGVRTKYLTFSIRTNGKQKFHSVHQEVMKAFSDHTTNGSTSGLIVDHIDDNKLNNNLNNLRLVDNRTNCIKAVDKTKTASKYLGVIKGGRGGNSFMSKTKFRGKYYYLGASKNEFELSELYRKAIKLIYSDLSDFDIIEGMNRLRAEFKENKKNNSK